MSNKFAGWGFYWKDQGCIQNLKAVPKNFKEVFKVDCVTSNDVIQKKQQHLRKEKLQISHISIFNIKLLKKTWKLVFISKEITSQFQYFFRLKFVWRLHSTIFELIKLLQICVYVSIARLILTKNSRRTSSLHLSFQSLNNNTRVGHERCSRFIKISTKTKVNCCSILVHNAANHVIAKNNCQSSFKKFEVLFSRKQQSAMRADWKIYLCIFYHFSIDIFSIMTFQMATSLSIFSTTRPF